LQKIDKSQLFRFPWSNTDNPGGWIEVTDICNLKCPGCFRYTLTGHRPVEEIMKEVIQLQRMTNCSRISISGGEPLLYPDIVEVVKFISNNKLKTIILTNGEALSEDLIRKLYRAGLYQFYFHVDSNQNRPGWEGKPESEMNELRQNYIDMVNRYSRIKCGFLTTVSRSTLHSLPDIIQWFHHNTGKVIHMAFIAFRGIPLTEDYDYYINDLAVDPAKIPNVHQDISEINISIEELFQIIKNSYPRLNPCAYLNGTTKNDTYKFLIINSISSRKEIYGSAGAGSVALQQFMTRFFTGKYTDTVPKTGREIFLLSIIDRQIRMAFLNYLKTLVKNPLNLVKKVSLQSIVLQQPFEIIEGKPNLCDGCINMMIYKDELINSCRLDEYRILGGTLSLQKKQKSSVHANR